VGLARRRPQARLLARGHPPRVAPRAGAPQARPAPPLVVLARVDAIRGIRAGNRLDGRIQAVVRERLENHVSGDSESAKAADAVTGSHGEANAWRAATGLRPLGAARGAAVGGCHRERRADTPSRRESIARVANTTQLRSFHFPPTTLVPDLYQIYFPPYDLSRFTLGRFFSLSPSLISHCLGCIIMGLPQEIFQTQRNIYASMQQLRFGSVPMDNV